MMEVIDMAWTRLFDPWAGDPRADFGRLRREMDEVFGRLVAAPGLGRGTPFPPVNLYETADGYMLTAELPGLEPKDVDLSIEGNRVTLRGERKIEVPDDKQTSLHRRERQSGIFRRTVELPQQADPEKAQAVYRNGVLWLHIPKAPEAQPRRIAVQGS
jgi:HSP20 family protein